MLNRIFLLPTILLLTFGVVAQKNYQVLTIPATADYTHIDLNGKSVLPSGRTVTPAGKTIQITHDPFGMAVSPDGTTIVTLHNGVFTIINRATLDNIRVPSYDKQIPSPLSHGSFLGVAFGSDNRTIYLSGGDNGAVIVYDITDRRRTGLISLNGLFDSVDYQDSFTSDLLYNEPGHELLVLDRGNFRLVRIDLATQKITASIKTGRQPFGLAISPDHTKRMWGCMIIRCCQTLPRKTSTVSYCLFIRMGTIPKSPGKAIPGREGKFPVWEILLPRKR
jgi:YVTN family beta-propeller protein